MRETPDRVKILDRSMGAQIRVKADCLSLELGYNIMFVVVCQAKETVCFDGLIRPAT